SLRRHIRYLRRVDEYLCLFVIHTLYSLVKIFTNPEFVDKVIHCKSHQIQPSLFPPCYVFEDKVDTEKNSFGSFDVVTKYEKHSSPVVHCLRDCTKSTLAIPPFHHA
ncbi:hypothetical protein NPIL_550161, partial [Nephila pilipes]